MKRFILCCILLNVGLCAFAAESANKAVIKYNVFAPEQQTGAVLNTKPTEKEGSLYYILPSKSNLALASNIEYTPNIPSHDPYIFKYKNDNYIFMSAGTKKLGTENILGIRDTREDIFKSLSALDKNNNNKITPAELKQSNIRIMKIAKNGKLINNKKSDFPADKINYIDLSQVKNITNTASTGINAHYTIYLKNKKEKITGLVISTQDDIINNLF